MDKQPSLQQRKPTLPVQLRQPQRSLLNKLEDKRVKLPLILLRSPLVLVVEKEPPTANEVGTHSRSNLPQELQRMLSRRMLSKKECLRTSQVRLPPGLTKKAKTFRKPRISWKTRIQ